MLLVVWRLAGMLMDLVLLVIIVTGLVVCRRWSSKRKNVTLCKRYRNDAFDRVSAIDDKNDDIIDCRCGESP